MMTIFIRFRNQIATLNDPQSAGRRWGLPLLIFLLALWPRLANPDTFITYDEYDQLEFAARFLRSVMGRDWAGALVLGYPGVPTMALGALGIWLQYQWGLWSAAAQSTLFASPVTAVVQTSAPAVAGNRLFLPVVINQLSPLAPFDRIAATITQQPLHYLSAARWPLIVVSAVMVTVIFLLLRQLVGTGVAFGATLLISFNPLFLALSKIIHVDAPLSYFMFASFIAFVLYLQAGNYGVLALSGLLGAMAVLSKTPALILGPILFVTGLIFIRLAHPSQAKQIRRRVIVSLLGWGLVAGIAFFVFWPAMWTRPLFALNWIFQNIIQNNQQTRSGSGIFWGYFGSDKNPLYYTYAFPFRWTPLTTVGVASSIGMVVDGFKRRRDALDAFAARRLSLVVSLQAFVLIFMVAISVVSRRSVRYSLPAMFPLELLAMFGLVWLAGQVSRIRQKSSRQHPKAAIWILAGAIVIQIFVVVQYQPYYYTYFNPVLGGYRTAPKLVNMGLGEGLDGAARYLNQTPDATSQITAAWFHRQFEPYYSGKATQIFDVADVVSADHSVFYITQIQLGFPSEELLDYFADRVPEKIITLGGIEYAWIYPGPIIGGDVPEDVSQPVKHPLNERLVLQGMDVAPLRDDAIPVTLFWRAKDTLPPDMNVSLRLVDAEGEVWGQVDRLPIGGLVRTQAWQPGDVIRDEYNLRFNPATPPGDYFLSVQMYNFTTGDVFGAVNQVGQVTISVPEKVVSVTAFEAWRESGQQSTGGGPPVKLGDGLALMGDTFRDFETLPGYRTTFKMYWRARKIPPTAPLVSLVARAANGAEIPLADVPIGKENYPANLWRRGELLGQTVLVRFPAEMRPGAYTLLATADDAVATLGTVTVRAQAHIFDLPADARPTDARFGDVIALAGYTIAPAEGAVDVSLFWRTDRSLDDDLKVFVHITDAAGTIIAQRDSIPAAGARPTLTWVGGEIITDSYHIPVENISFTVWVGLYNPLTGERLPVDGGGLPVSENRLQLQMTSDK